MSDQTRLERALARQSLIHHRKREEELERQLADLIALAKHKRCDCPAGKALRQLAKELEG